MGTNHSIFYFYEGPLSILVLTEYVRQPNVLKVLVKSRFGHEIVDKRCIGLCMTLVYFSLSYFCFGCLNGKVSTNHIKEQVPNTGREVDNLKKRLIRQEILSNRLSFFNLYSHFMECILFIHFYRFEENLFVLIFDELYHIFSFVYRYDGLGFYWSSNFYLK